MLMTMRLKLLLVVCTPIVIFAVISLILGLAQFSSILYDRTEAHLKSTALAALTVYNGRGYGDYSKKPDGNIWRGMNFNISTESSIVDDMKNQSTVDITVFFDDEAIMTSIFNKDEERCIGMQIDNNIKRNVIERGYQLWCKSIIINDIECQAYVIPIRQESDDHVVGAIMASQSIKPFKWDITKYIFKTMIVMVLTLVTVFLFILRHVDSFTQKFTEIADKSQQDLLTGLYNKMSFEENATKGIESCYGTKEVAILIIFDFDNFKHVNDDYGHQVGDAALKGFARILKRSFRNRDIIGRVGGDEFMAFLKLPKKSIGRVEEIANEVQHELYNLRVYSATHFSCSIGIGTDSTGKYNFGELYKLADKALYQAKENGKACFVKISSSDSESNN